MDIELRGLGRDDIPAWTRLLAEVEAVDDAGESYNEADLLEEMQGPDVTPGRDLVGAFDGQDLVGWFGVYPRNVTAELLRVAMDGAVRPDRRGEGIGTVLVAAMLARAREAHAERAPGLTAVYTGHGLGTNTAQAALFGGLGLQPDRYEFGMRMTLGPDLPSHPVLDGLRLRPFDPEADSDELFAAHNEAFLDHPGFTPWSTQMWQQYAIGSRNCAHAMSVLAVDADDRIAGYVSVDEYDAYQQVTGRREAYVARVGTLRPFRGRGLAGAMLPHVVRACAAAGYDEASLDVDSENPTGALGVYERCGFVVERRFTSYRLTEPA